MNVRPSPRMVRLLPAAVWAMAAMGGVDAALAQVPLPQANHAAGDDYQYPLHTMIAPVVRVRPTREDGRAAVMRKLMEIVIPAVDFHATALRDALEQLRLESFRYDPDPDPITRGVKIILRLPPAPPVSPGGAIPIPGLPNAAPGPAQPGERTLITLSLGKTRLFTVLQHLAAQAGLRLETREDAACLLPNAYPAPAPTKPPIHSPSETP